jgi:hypothetical protein
MAKKTSDNDTVANTPKRRTRKPVTLPPAADPIAQNRLPEDVALGALSDPIPDPFDPESLKLSTNYAEAIGVQRVLTVVPCRKPDRKAFVRVRAGIDWQLDTATFHDPAEGETYLVTRDLWPDLMDEIDPVRLRLAIARPHGVFLWPLKLPKCDGRSIPWHESAIAAANLAEKRWVRVSANMAHGMYDVAQAMGDLAEPEWPDVTFKKILKLCFQGRLIDSQSHPILQQLRGEV